MPLTRRTGGPCTGQRTWVSARACDLQGGSQGSLTDHTGSFSGRSDLASSLGFSWIEIWSIFLAGIGHSSWAVALPEIYFSYREQEACVMAWTPLSAPQSGLESCTNGASFNLLWKQDKVLTKKAAWLAKQGCKCHLSFHL